MARTTTLRNNNAARSNTSASGVPQGTPGGVRQAVGSRVGSGFQTEYYLWVLVLLEVGILAGLRNKFRRYHGG